MGRYIQYEYTGDKLKHGNEKKKKKNQYRLIHFIIKIEPVNINKYVIQPHHI